MSDSKKYPKFSVLMSVYKKENPEYLDLALKSIEYQTVKPDEVILVEDGPINDELQNVISNHQLIFGDGFKVIKTMINMGLGDALRLGTKYVSTNWIARMDSDDYSVPDRFEKQLKFIFNNPNLAVVGGQIDEFSIDINNIIGIRKVPTSSELIRTFIKWRSPFNHPTVMINKKKLLQVGGYIKYGKLEDYYLWARMIKYNLRVANLPYTLVHMRVDNGMYERRGSLENLRYIFKLRQYLYHNHIVNRNEEIIGILIMLMSLVIPSSLRKMLYQKFLHRS